MKNNVLLLRLGMSIFFLFCLFSCTVGPDFEKPKLYENTKIQKALELKPSEKNTKNSYLIFNDKVLNRLIGMAVENAPSVKEAISAVKQARLAAQIANVQGLPSLNSSAQYDYVKESRNIGYILNQDVYQVGLDASWELDIFGSLRRRSEAALASAYATIANLENVYVSLTSQVTLAYISLRQGQSMEKLLNQELEIQNNILSDTLSLWQSGLVSQDVLNQIKIDVQKVLSQISTVQTQIKNAENQLALLTGQLPNQMTDLLKAQKNNIVDRTFSFDIMRFYNMSAEVLENRPDVKAVLYELKAQNAQIGVAVADLYPKLSLSAMLGFQSLHLSDLLNHKSYAYSVTPSLSVPLFYFGQLKNKVKIEEEKYNQLFAQYENTFLTAAQEVKDAMIALQNAQKQYDTAKKSLLEMEKNYQLANNKKEAGLINEIELYKIQIQFLTLQQNYLSANSALYEATVRFFKSIAVVS